MSENYKEMNYLKDNFMWRQECKRSKRSQEFSFKTWLSFCGGICNKDVIDTLTWEYTNSELTTEVICVPQLHINTSLQTFIYWPLFSLLTHFFPSPYLPVSSLLSSLLSPSSTLTPGCTHRPTLKQI